MNQSIAISSERQRCLTAAINLLGVVPTDRRQSGPFPFILRTHLAYDVSTGLEASEHDDVRPVSDDVRAAVEPILCPYLAGETSFALTGRAQSDRPHRI